MRSGTIKKVLEERDVHVGGQTIQTTRYVTVDGSSLNPVQVINRFDLNAALRLTVIMQGQSSKGTDAEEFLQGP